MDPTVRKLVFNFELSSVQHQIIHRFWDLWCDLQPCDAAPTVEDGDHESLDDEDEDEDEDHDEDEDEDEGEDEGDTLADLVGQLTLSLIVEEFRNGRPSSTLLVYYSGILSFSTDGATFARPRNYTSYLSALIYCARLTILERSLPRWAHPYMGWRVRPRHSHLRQLDR
jgi:hypothetical protein